MLMEKSFGLPFSPCDDAPCFYARHCRKPTTLQILNENIKRNGATATGHKINKEFLYLRDTFSELPCLSSRMKLAHKASLWQNTTGDCAFEITLLQISSTSSFRLGNGGISFSNLDWKADTQLEFEIMNNNNDNNIRNSLEIKIGAYLLSICWNRERNAIPMMTNSHLQSHSRFQSILRSCLETFIYQT